MAMGINLDRKEYNRIKRKLAPSSPAQKKRKRLIVIILVIIAALFAETVFLYGDGEKSQWDLKGTLMVAGSLAVVVLLFMLPKCSADIRKEILEEAREEKNREEMAREKEEGEKAAKRLEQERSEREEKETCRPRVIDGGEIITEELRRVNDKEFEELIRQCKALSKDEMINSAGDLINSIYVKFLKIWDNDKEEAIKQLLGFVVHATRLACTGNDHPTSEMKDQIISYFQRYSGIAVAIRLTIDDMTDYHQLDNEGYSLLVDPYLSASLQPFTSDYPPLLFTYMLYVACAENINEKGIDAIRKLRNDYIDFVIQKGKGEVSRFTGTY